MGLCEVARQRYGFGARVADIAPDIFYRAALIAFGLTGLPVVTREEKRFPIRRIGAFRGLRQRNDLALSNFVDGDEFGIGQSRVSWSAHQDAAVRSPAGHHGSAIPGAALGQSTFDGHGVHVERAFIFRAEGDGGSVGRNGGVSFHARV